MQNKSNMYMNVLYLDKIETEPKSVKNTDLGLYEIQRENRISLRDGK